MSMQISYKKQILFFTLLVFIVLLCVEGILRGYDYFFPACSFFDSEVFENFSSELKHKICSDNSKLVWNDNPLRLIPNQHLEITNINSEGFRGNEIRKDVDYRIFLVGGSTMFGVGSSSDETTIPGYLKKYFISEQNKIEIINAGIPKGYSISEIEYIENKLIHYNPNLIIIYDGWNDLDKNFQEFNTTEERSTNEFIRMINRGDYQTPKIILQHYFNWKNENVVRNFDSRNIEEKSSLWIKNWTHTCEILNEKNIKVIVILQPILGTGNKILSIEEEKYSYIHDSQNASKFYEIYGEKLQLLKNSCYKTLDYRDVFDNYNNTIYFDGGHVGDLGNKIISDKIYLDIAEIIN